MITPTEQGTNPAITYVRRPRYAQWGFRLLLAGAATFGVAGTVEQIVSKGSEFGIVAVRLNDSIGTASGKAGESAAQRQGRIAAYEATIAGAYHDRDNDWRLGGMLLAAATIGAAIRVAANAQERQIPTIPVVSTTT